MCWIGIGAKIGSVKTKVRVSTAQIKGYFGEIVVVALRGILPPQDRNPWLLVHAPLIITNQSYSWLISFGFLPLCNTAEIGVKLKWFGDAVYGFESAFPV